MEFDSKIKTLRLYAFGEPLLNPDFHRMVMYAKQYGLSEDIDTTTNGILLNPELNTRLTGVGLDRINISVVGVNDDQYKAFTGRNVSFDKLVDNIADLYSKSVSTTVFVKINGDVISKEDQEKFIEIFEPISHGCAVEHIMDCWYDVDMDGIKKNQDVGVYGQPLTWVNVCPYIFYSFTVHWDGVVSACFLDWDKRIVIGDAKADSLKSIWNGASLRGLRKAMLCGKRHGTPICQDCDQLVAGQPENIDHLAEELLEKI
jgi:MoaA/NifB/PqqE/SkfB family radical SAM enzyme